MDKKPGAVIYARYSSHAQREVSIEQQLRACKKFAEQQGIEILKTYEDRALTGTSDRRPGFQQMIKDAERSDWIYVIVYTLDRFARDRYDSAVYKRQLKNHGVRVLSAMENISDDPTGVLMESLLEGLAEYYSKELARKVRRGMEDNAQKCLVNGQLPLGFIRGPDGKYAIDETEAAIVREIFGRVHDGEKLSEIIRDLNARGIHTKTGAAWNRSSFNQILSNERYAGVYIYGETRIPGGVPQIVDRELFDGVQYVVRAKPNPRSNGLPQRRRRENGIYLLTGKIFCGDCKSPMVGMSGTGKSGTPHYYYVCKNKRERKGCHKAAVRRDQIERTVATALKNKMLTDKGIIALADAAIEYRQQQSGASEVDALRTRLQAVQQSIKNLVAAVEAGVFTASTQNRLLELEEEQKLLSGQLSIAQENEEKALTREEIISMLKMYQQGSIDDKDYQETLIDTFLVAVYVYDDHLKIAFRLDSNNSELTAPLDIDSIFLALEPGGSFKLPSGSP